MSQRPSTRSRSQPYQKPVRAEISAPRGPAADGIPTTGRLAISNLHYEVNAQDLIKIFGRYGTFVRDPFIKYDRSGRSTGNAVVEFTTMGDAASAKNALNGEKAKGQQLNIRFDTIIRRAPRANAGSEQGAKSQSLANRIAKAPLIHRLNDKMDEDEAPPATSKATSGPGPVRATRSANRGTGTGRSARGPREPKAKPKTADDLDKELEAFMQDKKESDPPVQVATGEDVAMAT